MHLTIAVREIHPRRVFRIARARKDALENVFIRLDHDGISGFGEASPNIFYAETPGGVIEKLERIRPAISEMRPASVEDIAAIWEETWPALAPSRAAQCALDLALWDWLGKRLGKSAAELAWGAPFKPVESFCTIGLSSPEELEEKVQELQGYPWIKIKSDQAADLAPIKFIRERTTARLAVDANCAWGGQDLGRLCGELRDLGVEFIEQPFPPGENATLAGQNLALPVLADESCVTEQDVDRVSEHFSGFNIKLVKCGGITPAIRMLRRGRELDRKVMVGCMLESSALIAAGAVIGQQTDYADLDGAWLLADDPFTGLPFETGTLRPAETAVGLGIVPPIGLFPPA
jgi:L-alanine-DL-glutamate epimerase-like enolase superfamily enzyme